MSPPGGRRLGGRPRLTLCLMVRDEEDLLPGCLASVKGVVDEIVAVDTGSRDATPRILRESGARVEPFAWRDDFAAARNAALALASGAWILSLDADERLAPRAGTAIRAALDANRIDGGLLPLYDANRLDASPEDILSGRARDHEPILLPRLLRRTPDLAWHGIVHEELVAWLGAPGRRLARVDAPILHLGAVPGLRADRGKANRNTRLIERRLEDDPDWLSGWEFLADERLKAGDAAGASTALDRGWEVAGRRASSSRKVPIALLTVRRAEAKVRTGDFEGALKVVSQARAWCVDHPNLDWTEAWILGQRASLQRKPDPADLVRILTLLERCESTRGSLYAEVVLPGIQGRRAVCAAGHALGMLGRPADALTAFDAVLAEDPADRAARCGRVEALLDLGDARRALAEAMPLVQEDIPDAWMLAAMAAAALGARKDARGLIQEAGKRLDRAWILPRRRFREG